MFWNDACFDYDDDQKERLTGNFVQSSKTQLEVLGRTDFQDKDPVRSFAVQKASHDINTQFELGAYGKN